MTRRISSICYKMFVCLSLMLGIFFNLNQTTSRKALLSYYTLQSNIICLIAFLIFLVFEIIKKAHKLPFELGCERVITTVRIDEKFGGLTINDKLKNHRQV